MAVTLRLVFNAEGYGYVRDTPRPMIGWLGPLPTREAPPTGTRTIRAWARDASSAGPVGPNAEGYAFALVTLAAEHMTGRRRQAMQRGAARRWWRLVGCRVGLGGGRECDRDLYSRPEGPARWP